MKRKNYQVFVWYIDIDGKEHAYTTNPKTKKAWLEQFKEEHERYRYLKRQGEVIDFVVNALS